MSVWRYLQLQEAHRQAVMTAKISLILGPIIFLMVWAFVHTCLKKIDFKWWQSLLGTCVLLTILSFAIPTFGVYLISGWYAYVVMPILKFFG